MFLMRNTIFLALGLTTLLLSGCTEIPPLVTPAVPQESCENPDPTRVSGQQTQVLVEEFTGVQCVNCPAGSQALEELAAIHGERLVVVSIHSGFFADPYPESNYDFQTPEGDQLASLLGSPLGYPTAVINRRKFAGESRLQLGRNKWAGYVAEELARPRVAALDIIPLLDLQTLDLEVRVSAFFDASPTLPLKISLFITEDGIADWQKTPDGDVPDYLHRHVFRTAIGPYNGSEIKSEALAGNVYCAEFSTKISPDWNRDKLYLIAILSRADGDLEVLQAGEQKIIP